jgi:hypothetical protein
MRQIKAFALLACALTSAAFCLPAAATAAQATKSQRISAERALSTTERDRILTLLERGDSFDAWRFAFHSLSESDFVIRENGNIVLLKLTAREQAFREPARALLEDVLVRRRDLDWSDKTVLVGEFGMFSGPPGASSIDLPSSQQSQNWASDSQRIRHLSRGAISYCSGLLASADASKRRASIPILLVGAELGGRDRDWSIKLCRRQLREVTGDRATMWAVLYETVIGKFLPRLR